MGRNLMYNYRDWIDGEFHILTRPDDFAVPIASFRVMLHEWCNAHGYKAQTTRIDDNSLAVRIVRKHP